jgi:hypothetical protein
MSWRDAYNIGTYLFLKGNYEVAMEKFLKGAEISLGEKKRTSLVAAAVCALGMDNSEKFLEIMETLKTCQDQDPLKQPTISNSAYEVLEEIKR